MASGQMKYNPDIHKRQSIRLKGHNYSKQGLYFITICIQNRECLLGDINKDTMILNSAGYMVQQSWNELPEKFLNITLDLFIIMPNHLHGIIVITRGYECNGGEPCVRPYDKTVNMPDGTKENTIGRILQIFKSVTTCKYAVGVKEHEWQPFQGKLWQRNYYDHIIRDKEELTKIREYIINNPLKWNLDEENPEINKKTMRCRGEPCVRPEIKELSLSY
jgi:putative transposase